MVSAQVFVALVESPRNGKAGDYAAEEILGLVRAHYGHAGAIEINLAARLIQFQKAVLPMLPVPDVVLAQFVAGLEQTGARFLSGFGPDAAEPQRQGELSVTCRQVNFAGERDVSVFRVGVIPGHLEMLREVLPSVGESGKAHRHLPPGNRAGEGEGGRFAMRIQRRRAFVVPDPAGIFPAAIRQMGRQQSVQAIVGQRALQRDEADPLQHDIAVRIGEDFFLDPVTSLQFCVSEFVNRNARLDAHGFQTCSGAFLRRNNWSRR